MKGNLRTATPRRGAARRTAAVLTATAAGALLLVATSASAPSAAGVPAGAQAASGAAAQVKLELRPWGMGSLVLDPPGLDERGVPAPACDRTRLSDFRGDLCTRYYEAGTVVTVHALPVLGGEFLGWSEWQCAATASCRLTLEAAETSLVGRFTPTRIGIRMRGEGAGRVVSDPPGLVCTLDEGDCVGAAFPVGRPIAVAADETFTSVAWKFGCTAPPGSRRCTVTPTNDPHWIGVAVGRDLEIRPPATISVRFGVAREGQGTVAGRQIDCGTQCERRYDFGEPEALLARPASGWRFTQWRGGCPHTPPCRVVVGPVTSVQAVFTRNLVPRLLAVTPTGRGTARRLVVRVSVVHAARARIVLRRVGAPRVAVDRTLPLRGGTNALSVPIPRTAPAGLYRVTVAVSDGQGGGRTYTLQRRIGR
jgi:hypothetical protein